MRSTMGLLIALVAVLGTGVAAQSTNTLRLTLGSQKRIWLDGTSTVRKFTCATEDFTAVPTPPPAPEAPLAGAVHSVDVTIPVKNLDCGNGKMDEHMRKALKAEENPEIRFSLESYRVGARTEEGTPVQASGSLTIAGQSRPVELDGVVTPTATGLRVQGEKEIRMTDWGVKPPKLMLGALKVGDTVTIHYDVVLEK